MLGFKKKTLPDILATFTKTLEDLKGLSDDNRKEVSDNKVLIEHLEVTNTTLEEEATKADAVAAKIQALVTP